MGTTSPTPLSRIFENTLVRYATALAAILVALLVRGALSPFVGDYVPFITLFPAVIFAAWFCGTGPSILSVVVALLGARFLFVRPVHSFNVPDTHQSVAIHAFLLASALIVATLVVNHRYHEVLPAA